MLSRSAFARTAQRALRTQGASGRRAFASAESPSLQYETTEAAGVKLANRDVGGPTTTLALVAKAGPRYQPFPGFTDALEQFAFKTTLKRSGLRITREAELLGSDLTATHTRENVILQAKFLSEDLPYFTELLAEVSSQTKYSAFEWNELILPTIKLRQQTLLENAENLALNSAHSTAFHRGLGESLFATSSTPLESYFSSEGLAEYAQSAYAKSNIALVSVGPNSAELSKWVSQFFGEHSTATPSSQFKVKESSPSKFYGGEQRTSSKAGNAVVISFPGSAQYGASGYKPEAAVLAALLGGESSIKWTPGFSLLSKAIEGHSGVKVSTKNYAYSDAGLFTISVTGKPESVSAVSKRAADALKKVAGGEVAAEDIKKAIALAKFRTLEAAQVLETGVELTGSALINGTKALQISDVASGFDKVSPQQVQELAKSFVTGKASVAVVGDLFKLPFAEDLGLTV
ncbi:putative ubiquinol-cytochrome C reductase complex core protein 2 [Talaromyces proteolyticus]|uniref:Cytochrome b-c1 complex subunit 2, mitochondrial n=1 Tax=Talaromyces proteolyticus TaxID=1131652 RepID=A0AAD4KFW1_9EURO|nr:putative ubiquinol-cytochrome C reductase complex core protein 2 [Talaromyces proteolyticus]KAH8691124.1 putative ubiquinol-cytochrome C reductase complex core protein 2 [Talaromyces proteolyticus]